MTIFTRLFRVLSISLSAFSLLIFTQSAFAKGVSGLLPLNLSLVFEQKIEQVFAVTGDAPLTKPYHVKALLERVDSIKSTYPALYAGIQPYLEVYKKQAGLTQARVDVTLAESGDMNLPNRRGTQVDDPFVFSAGGFYQPSDYLLFAADAIYSDEAGMRHAASYVAVGGSYMQMEFGYRDHWFSPFAYSSMLVSTHAEASPSVTLSNAEPISDWNIQYTLFYSKLEPHEQIRLGDTMSPGSPRHGGIHISLSPLENWTIGVNRTLQFGGGERDFSFGDVLEALFDPAGKDNVGDVETDDPNYEFGNQQASITTAYQFNWGMPVQLYAEFGGEDTRDESNYKLGNQTYGVGLFLPVVTDKMSLRAELNHWADKWYVHHLYPAGYTNNNIIMGHWAAEQREDGDSPASTVLTLGMDYQIDAERHWSTRGTLISNDDEGQAGYETGYLLQIDYSQNTGTGDLGVGVFISKNTLGDTQSALTLSFSWN